MAVILKSPDVNAEVSRKLDYATSNPDKPVDHEVNTRLEMDFSEELLTPDYMVAQEASSSLPETEYEHIDGKIIYQGNEYISEKLIDAEVSARFDQKLPEFEKLKLEQIEEAKVQGYEEGLEVAKQEYLEKQSVIEELINNINHAMETKVKGNYELLQDIVFTAITRVLGEKITETENRLSVIKTVIESIGTASPFVLKISKDDYNELQKNDALRISLGADKIISDSRVSIGGCIIETKNGIFDGRLEVQLARLKEAIDARSDS